MTELLEYRGGPYDNKRLPSPYPETTITYKIAARLSDRRCQEIANAIKTNTEIPSESPDDIFLPAREVRYVRKIVNNQPAMVME